VVYSEARQQRVHRTVDQQRAKPRDAGRKAFKKLCAQTFACAVDARQALAQFKATVEVTRSAGEEIRPSAPYGGHGRPAPGQPPERVDSVIAGALASSLAQRRALWAQQRGFVLATNELEDRALRVQEVLGAYKAQSAPERGGRFRKAPQFLASSL